MIRTRPILLGGIAAVFALVTACSSSGGASSTSPTTATAAAGVGSSTAAAAPSAAAAASLTISLKSGHLTAPDGRTLYTLSSDKAGNLACSGGCLTDWPPVLGKGKAGAGVDDKAFATVARGSSTQVTYNGHPLYMFAGDSKPGDTNGNGIKAFGGIWNTAKSADDNSGSGSSAAPSGGGSGGGYP